MLGNGTPTYDSSGVPSGPEALEAIDAVVARARQDAAASDGVPFTAAISASKKVNSLEESITEQKAGTP